MDVSPAAQTVLHDAEPYRESFLFALIEAGDMQQVSAALKRAADAAIDEVTSRHSADAEAEGRSVYPGRCQWSVSAERVLLRLDEKPEDPRLLVELIATHLTEEGIGGSLVPFTPPPIQAPPSFMRHLEARLRVDGERLTLPRGRWMWRWQADEEALRVVALDAVQWCLDSPVGGSVTAHARMMPREALGVDRAVSWCVSRLVDGGAFDVVNVGAGQLRMAAVDPYGGRVSIVQGVDTLWPEHWQPALENLEAFVNEHSARLVYGLIKHGGSLTDVQLANSLAYGWPPRQGFQAPQRKEVSTEDEFAPDAFVFQLLGPGYAGRVPDGTSWIRMPLDNDRVAVRHHAPQQWFDIDLRPYDPTTNLTNPNYDAPAVLAQARQDFAEILFRDAIGERESW